MGEPPRATKKSGSGEDPLRVGEWLFSAERHTLRRGLEERRVEPKAAAVLARLAARPGRVCTREELLEAAWPGLFVTEEVLTNTVYQLRRALDDDARRPCYIETIPRKGYRLAVTATLLSAAGVRRRPRSWRTLLPLTTALALAATLVASHRLVGPPPDLPAESSEVGAPERFGAAAAEREVAAGWRALETALPGAAFEALAAAGRALAADPGAGEAWALGAAAWAGQVAAGAVAPAEGWDRAQPFLARALALDPTDSMALTSRALLRWLARWDWEGAEADLAAAVAARPEAAAPRALRSQLWAFSGRSEPASREAAAAVSLAPDSARVRLTAAMVAALCGDESAAGGHLRAVLDRHPTHPVARQQLVKLEAPPPQSPAGGAKSPAAAAGDLDRLAAKGQVTPGVVAVLYAQEGDGAKALEWLERAVDAHDATVLFFPFDPRWDSLKEDPRYVAAMARLRRPEASS